jgi:hypothetical protein
MPAAVKASRRMRGVGGAGYGDGFERERVAENFQAGLGESVVVDTAGIAQQGAVDVEEVGVVLIPTGKRVMGAGTPGDATLRGEIFAIAHG